MSQLVYIPTNDTTKLNGNSFRKDWNERQNLSTQGHYIEPKIFSGFQNPRIKLTTVKKQSYNPQLSTIRHIERLSDEQSRHITSNIEEQYQNLDSKKEEFSRLNWNPTGNTFLGVNDSPLEFLDKSQKYIRQSQSKLYRSSSLFSTTPSATLTKSYIKSRFHSNTKSFNHPVENIFRSSSMYVDESAVFGNPSGNNDGLKSSRI